MMFMDKYRVKVHRKGLIVIPAEVRKRLGIHENSYLELTVDGNVIHITIPRDLRSFFGADGDKALEVVRLIHRERMSEVEKEIHS